MRSFRSVIQDIFIINLFIINSFQEKKYELFIQKKIDFMD